MNQTHIDEDNPVDLSQHEDSKSNSVIEEKKAEFDSRKYRQFKVKVYVDIRNVHGHLVKVKHNLFLLDFTVITVI